MEYKKIALIGAGAVGAYFIYGFTDQSDLDFCLVAEGERSDRLKKNGVMINDQTYYPKVKSPEEAKGADLLLVCTKYHGLTGALDMIETIVDEHTVVMSLLNGINSEDLIAERIGGKHLLYSVTRISSERRDGRIHFVPETTPGITVGERDSSIPSPRVQAFMHLMRQYDLHCRFSENIRLDQWSKYSMNIIYNLPQAVLDVGFGAYFDSSYVAAIRDRLFEEVCAVANAEGIPLKEQQDWRSACVNTARFSTLQDLDAHRTTEIDLFTGVLISLAEKHGISVPFAEYTHFAIKALEEKNAGRFQY